MNEQTASLSRKYNIRWVKSDRFEHKGGFTLNAPAEEIFPLLCPVLEYAWLPGWSCRMVYSESGVAEKDNVFLTRENLGRTAIWTCITYEPDSLIEYLITSGTDAVTRLSIRLKGIDRGRTEIDWRMLFTSFSRLGRNVVRRRFTQAAFDGMMRTRERELNRYLAQGSMLGKK